MKQISQTLPSISVVTPTFNSAVTIGKCLKSIRMQNYPQKKIEIIIVDGGSKDETKKIASKYKVKLVNSDPKIQNVEYNKSLGIQKAKGDLLFMLDHDNILPRKDLINKMVKPFLENKKIVGVETLRYHYYRNATALDRYIALFGVNDPMAWYMGKADRMSYMDNGYNPKYNPIENKDYYIVTFKKNLVPTIGANGFMVKRELLINNANTEPGKYFPIDVNIDLIRKGFNTYAFVKDSIAHLSGHGSVIYYLRRRMLFVKQYYLNEENISLRSGRRYSLYESKDFWKLVYFIFASITLLIPLSESIRGYYKLRDSAWFLHPVICLGFVLMYGYVIVEHQVKLSLRSFS